MKERGPGQELTLSFGSSFFCNQVFFVYDPSSSTSLLSSVSSDQEGESVRDGDGDVVRGPLQELALGRLALFVACPPMVEIMVTMMVEITTGGHASPRPPTC